MLPLDTVLTFFVTALLLALAPGPDIIFVLTQSALYGMRAGVATTLGLISGLCFHTTIVAVGVAGLVAILVLYLRACSWPRPWPSAC